MGYRLSKIVTRGGDAGMTGLGDGQRVLKHDPQIEALGEVDELNSQLGLVLCEPLPVPVRQLLVQIQRQLFDLGGELCLPGQSLLQEAQLSELEAQIAHWNATLPPLREFILPGGCRGAALLQLARAVCRRAERRVAALPEGARSTLALPYLNRLSDLLFILARVLNRVAAVAEPLWRGVPAP